MAKDYQRTDRIGELMQRELAKIIAKEMRDANLGLITVAAVKVSRDLSFAKVYITRLGSDEEAKQAVDVLNEKSASLRFHLAKHVNLRSMPQLTFVYDKTLLAGNALAALIDKAVASDHSDDNNDDEPNPF